MLTRHPHLPSRCQFQDADVASRPREAATLYFGPLPAVAAVNAMNTDSGSVTIAATTAQNPQFSAASLDAAVRRAVARMVDHVFYATAGCVL